MSIKANILAMATDAVTKERTNTHGSAADNFMHTARMWSAYLGYEISAHDVCQMMVLAKVSRAKVGQKEYADHYVDQCGYSALAGEMAGAK